MLKLAILGFWSFSGMVVLGLDEPPLPIWGEEERARMQAEGWVAGSSLLTYDPLPEVRDANDTPLAVEKPTDEEIRELVDNENVVDEKYLVDYFADSSSDFLIDPQNFLTEEKRGALESFLVNHAGDSPIDMRLYIFGADQVIPGDVREEEVVERLYSTGKPALVIYYYLGAPQRSDIYLSPVLTDTVSAGEQRRALQSGVVQALKGALVTDQLKAFLVQMSIRVYWMERMVKLAAEEGTTVLPAEDLVDRSAKEKVVEEGGTEISHWGKAAVGLVIVAFGSVMIALSLRFFLRRRARYLFPEFDIEPRMGGDHAAGVGAVISFSSSAVSPTNQRDQVPDYLRRA